MAKIIPEGWRQLEAIGSAERELQTLAILDAGLDDRYVVYHGVHWTCIDKNNYNIVGEIDFAIVGPTGKILLIEQKSGLLIEKAGSIVKAYRDKEKDVRMQMTRSMEMVHKRLRAVCKGEKYLLDSLLYCPDYRIKDPGTAGLDPKRIVDGSNSKYLVQIIQGILPAEGEINPATELIHRFFTEILELVPEVHAVVGEAGALATRLSGGLAYWARKIEADPLRMRVIGTAGSGKTQLAMAVYRDTIRDGLRPLYVCFNRPLADHINLIAPPGGDVVTYHQLGDRICRKVGVTPDFSKGEAYALIESILDGHTPTAVDQYDVLIVDEGQDLQESWAANLMRFLRPGGKAWWLEDPMQRLYLRAPVPLPGWTTIRSDTNYRTPKDILDTLNRLLPLERPIEAGSPLTGSEVDIVSYVDAADLIARTVSAVTKCIALGFKRQHIALVTYRGRDRSLFTPFNKIGPYSLKAPTGQYDLLGNPLYSDGDLLIDSVHRFKGRASPCVVLTEIDFETLDDAAVQRLFVGATRASMKLVLVVSERSASILLARLS